jgi:hypothetical protein
MRRLFPLPLIAAALVPAIADAAATTTSVSILAGPPARIVSVPDGGRIGPLGSRLDGLRLVDASGAGARWTLTASSERLRDGRRALPAGSLGLRPDAPVDAGAGVLLARGGAGVWEPPAGTALHVTPPASLRPGRYTATVTLTLAIGP